MSSDDSAEMVEFTTRVFGTTLPVPGPDEMAGIWAGEMLRGDHPTTTAGDGTVVVDSATNRIVSCCFLIPQTWTYAGLPFSVGRPEMIATDPDYRNRGLVRAQMEAIHAYSEAHGHRLQALTGIPYFYRQFGYEPALITSGERYGPVAGVPELAEGEEEPVRCRPAIEPDLPFITRMYEQAAARAMIAAVRDETIWRHELTGRDPNGDYWHELRVIETAAGEAVGFMAYVREMRGDTINCTIYELADGMRWEIATPPVLRYLRAAGEEIIARDGGRLVSIGFDWTPSHPVMKVADSLLPGTGKSFSWYVRLADIAGFIRHIAPVLERRLAESVLSGYTGEIRLAFYPNGLRLGFEGGRLAAAENLADSPYRTVAAAFPARTFLQLLLGSRSVEELGHAFPFESWVRTDTARLLLETLFPKQPSAIWPVA